MSGSFEERVHVVPAGRVRTIYDAIPATITTIATTATTIRTVRGFLFPPRGSIPGGTPLGSSVAATRSPPRSREGYGAYNAMRRQRAAEIHPRPESPIFKSEAAR